MSSALTTLADETQHGTSSYTADARSPMQLSETPALTARYGPIWNASGIAAPSGRSVAAEPITHKVWMRRSIVLALRIDRPLAPKAVFALGRELGWSRTRMTNVLAFAEAKTLTFEQGKWRRVDGFTELAVASGAQV